MHLKPNKISDLLPYQKHFSDGAFWQKLRRCGHKIGKEFLRYILVLYYVLVSPNVSVKNKSIICGALGYLILPADMLPDFIPALGFTDDFAAILLANEAIKSSVTPEISEKARRKTEEIFKA